MAGKQSAAVDRALRLVARGMTRYAAAKKCGLSLSTVYRAAIRQKKAQPPI
ncbi:MAG: helix-turn-helix domain-containing protein [Patescibacteria group bacterium]|nr:helix-turn-helix domain-containing protein [Patescibacteria group bacterium]